MEGISAIISASDGGWGISIDQGIANSPTVISWPDSFSYMYIQEINTERQFF